MTKIKELLAGREKLNKYDELQAWKEMFDTENATLRMKVDGEDAKKDSGWAYGFQLPSNIRQIFVKDLEAEIAKLDEE